MRLKITRNNHIVGDYPEEIMKVPQNMIKIIQNHFLEEFEKVIIEWYDETKTK